MAQTIREAAPAAAPVATTTPAAASTAVATAQPVDPALAILRQYWPQLKRLLPSHITGDAWYSAVYAALYRGQQPANKLNLWKAANANPESFLFSLFEAARLGHEPGTDHYYLTPRPNRNAPSGLEVLGMEGYQGVIERMYRAGAVTSVRVAEVRENDDYRYDDDVDLVPHHRFKKFARNADRGAIVGAYAYAVMSGGAVSKVVEINQDDIDRAKEASGSAKYTDKSTFWNHHHDVIAMVRKTAIHQLEKWVPTSSEFRRVVDATTGTGTAIAAAAGRVALATADAPSLAEAIAAAQDADGPMPPAPAVTEQDGDTVPEPPPNPMQFVQPPAPEDEPEEQPAAPVGEPVVPPPPGGWVTEFAPPEGASPDDEPIRKAITTAIGRILGPVGVGDDDRRAIAARLAGRTAPIRSTDELTAREGRQVVMTLTGWLDDEVLAPQVAAVLAAIAAPAADAEKLPDPGTKAWHEAQHPRRDGGGPVTTVVNLNNGDCGICEEIAAEAAR